MAGILKADGTFVGMCKGDPGPQGIQGLKGDKPDHQWNGTQLRFENPNATWGSYVDLKGPKGDTGDTGPQGPSGSSPRIAYAENWDNVEVGIGTWQPVVEVSINVPANGKVHIVANANVETGDGYKMRLGISEQPTAAPTHVYTVVGAFIPDGSGTVVAAPQWVTAVTPGTRTFYLVAKKDGASGTETIIGSQISATFIQE